jgi:hypothetical protein
LANDDEKYTERDIAKRPTIFECVEDERDLQNDIDSKEYCIEDVQNDEERGGGCRRQGSPGLEGTKRNCSRD